MGHFYRWEINFDFLNFWGPKMDLIGSLLNSASKWDRRNLLLTKCSPIIELFFPAITSFKDRYFSHFLLFIIYYY